MKIVTRFPPSPTGYFHIGSARTALFNYLFAAHHGGTMYLRFEDTDKERSKKEFEDDIFAGLKWLGIPYELPEVFRQSERTQIYKAYLKQLIDSGLAYEGEASTADPDKKIIRFRNPNVVMTFHDLIRGDITFDTKELGDFVIARSIHDPLYHLAVVVDDHEMGVSHVIRGEDHISNTPRQILILEALGFARPMYAHIPLILAPDRSKLSKRHGAVSVNDYQQKGYTPEALINYLALLGWNPGTDKEIFNMSELIESFSIEHIHKGGAIFNTEKLLWFNKEYLKFKPADVLTKELFARCKESFMKRADTWSDEIGERLVPIIRERVNVWHDIDTMIEEGELDYFFYDPQPTADQIPQKGGPHDIAATHLQAALGILSAVSDTDFSNADVLKRALWEYATEHGRGDVLWPLRYALSARAKSPDPFVLASTLGKETTTRRISAAIKLLGKA